ANFLVH
nr:Chain A, ANFLVH (residues 13-18) from islet amyloid polypeptide [Homo sapiens]